MKFLDKLPIEQTKLLLQKNSPSIFIGVGIAGMVTATVLACKATLKLDDELEDIKDSIEDVKDDYEDDMESSEYKKELTKTYAKGVYKVAKLYSPAVVIGAGSIYSILHGHNVLCKRNVALASAYELLNEGFEAYRKRVREELGEDADKKFRYGLEEKVIETVTVDDNGKEHKKKEKKLVASNDMPSIYSRFFDEGSQLWTKSPTSNLYTCRRIEEYANDKLNAHGHLFLNEVYDMLDIPRTDYGQLVGWLSSANGGKDGYVDFGIYDIHKEANRDFVNGYEPVILLDFNVDGEIYHRI